MHRPEQDHSEKSGHCSIGVGRRQFLTTAAGLLVPATGIMASSADAETGRAGRKHRRRRRRHEQHDLVGGYLTDDVIVKLINHTRFDWSVAAATSRSGQWFDTQLIAGRESGWNPGIAERDFWDETSVGIRWRNGILPGGLPNLVHYSFDVENPSVGKASASVYTWDNSGRVIMILKQSMREGELVSAKHGGLEFFVHRWHDGDEMFDGDTEEYCRFILRVVHS